MFASVFFRSAVPLLLLLKLSAAESAEFVEHRRYSVPEATQGVAVDQKNFFAIGNQVVAQYEKTTGERRRVWKASAEYPLVHLNAGVVREGKLYCAHSNFPAYPETSSIEIFDADTLKHVGTQSLGIYEGSLTWIAWRDGVWWATFAHYSERVNDNPHARDTRWTSLVQFDKHWRRTAGWVFPPEVLAKFEPHSCSGGAWDSAGRLWCSGHDRGELYHLELPRAGSTLRLVATVPAPITGQAFVFDESEPGLLWGIVRPGRAVVRAKWREARREN
jgi:hypothetical protein